LATNPTQLNALFAALGIPTQAPRLLIYTANGTHALDVSNILLLEAEGAYTTFHLKSGERIIASRVLREFEAQLPPQQFVRVHRSYLVRVSAIQSLQKAEEGSLRLTNGMLVPVARARRDDLLKLLQG
jgi:two-component system LytT family response regulator